MCRENKVDGTAVPQKDYAKLLFIGWEDAPSTSSISATIAQGHYWSGDALDKLGPLPVKALNES